MIMTALAQSSRIDLLFDIVTIYTRNLAMDLVRVTHFYIPSCRVERGHHVSPQCADAILTWV